MRAARVRVVAVPRSLAHPDEPPVAVAGQCHGRPAARGLQAAHRPVRRPRRSCGRHDDAAHRDVCGAAGPARRAATRQGGRDGRLAVGRPDDLRCRVRLERRGDGQPRRRDGRPLGRRRGEAGGDEAVVDAGHGLVPRTPRRLRGVVGVAEARAASASADPHRWRVGTACSARWSATPTAGCRCRRARSIEDRVARLHAEAERQGRDPSTLSITVADGRADVDTMRSLEAEGIDRVLLSVPPGDRDTTLRGRSSRTAPWPGPRPESGPAPARPGRGTSPGLAARAPSVVRVQLFRCAELSYRRRSQRRGRCRCCRRSRTRS